MTLSSFCVVCGFSASDLAEFVELSHGSTASMCNNEDNHYTNRTSTLSSTFMFPHKWGTRLCDLPHSMFMSCRQRGLQSFMHALDILQTRKLITCQSTIDAFTTTPLHELSLRLTCQAAHIDQDPIYYTLYDTQAVSHNSSGGTAYVLWRYWLPVWSNIDQHGAIPHLSSVMK